MNIKLINFETRIPSRHKAINLIFLVALCGPNDPDYEEVKRIYRQIDPKYFASRIRKCEMMADFLQIKKCLSINANDRNNWSKLDYFNLTNAHPGMTFKDFYEQCQSHKMRVYSTLI